jgi:hypothetical protein
MRYQLCLGFGGDPLFSSFFLCYILMNPNCAFLPRLSNCVPFQVGANSVLFHPRFGWKPSLIPAQVLQNPVVLCSQVGRSPVFFILSQVGGESQACFLPRAEWGLLSPGLWNPFLSGRLDQLEVGPLDRSPVSWTAPGKHKYIGIQYTVLYLCICIVCKVKYSCCTYMQTSLAHQ